MADPWKPLDGDDAAAAPGPRRLEPFTAAPILTEQGPSHNGTAPPPPLKGSSLATPGLAGHRALAALAAELAEAAAVDDGDSGAERGGDEDAKPPRDHTEDDAEDRPAGTAPGPVHAAGSRPAGSPTSPAGPVGGPLSPGGPAGGPVAPGGSTGGLISPDSQAGSGPRSPVGSAAGGLTSPDSPVGGSVGSSSVAGSAGDRPAGFPMARPLARLPLPGGPTGMRLSGTERSGAPELRVSPLSAPLGAPAPGAVRLPADRSTPTAPAATVAGAAGAATAAAAAEQSTIPLRKRATSDLPASVAPAPADAGSEAGATAPPGTTARSAGVVEPWSAGEDDILPGRQVRRSRPAWRRR